MRGDFPTDAVRASRIGGTPASAVSMSAAAKKFAQTHGLIGSVVNAKRLIEAELSPATPIRITLAIDPELSGYATLCFHIAITGSAERFSQLNDRVQDLIFDNVPAEHRKHLTFSYDLE